MRLSYNAPVTLSFSILASLVFLVDYLLGGVVTDNYFKSPSSFHSPVDYLRLISHVIGHADWKHLANNFLMILLLGPMLEEKYGSSLLLFMITATAALTAVLNIFLFPHTCLLGASGIVFMFIVLSSLVNREYDEIPLTFIVVALLYLSNEISAALLVSDNISHFSHLIGGAIGGIFGFLFVGERK